MAFESQAHHGGAKEWFGVGGEEGRTSASARAAKYRLVTLDKGFRQYENHDCLVLE